MTPDKPFFKSVTNIGSIVAGVGTGLIVGTHAPEHAVASGAITGAGVALIGIGLRSILGKILIVLQAVVSILDSINGGNNNGGANADPNPKLQ